MRMLDSLGEALERRLDAIERRFGAHPIGSIALGVLLASGVIVGGLATFVAVLAVLVTFFS